jgi:Zn-dependent peptidase ImmA (M78 family)
MKGKWSFMDIPNGRRQALEGYADAVLRMHKIPSGGSVDVIELASRLGFTIVEMDLSQDDSAFILVNESQEEILGFKTQKLIGINTNLQEKDRRFAIGHELAHYFLDFYYTPNKPYGVFANKTKTEEPQTYNETEMDFFSACLLMPSSSFSSMYGALKGNTTTDEGILKILSDIFVVPEEIAAKRAEELELV